MSPNTIPALVITELLDAEIMRGRRTFIFPAHENSSNDQIVHEVAMRVGCDNLEVGMREIQRMDKRTKQWKMEFNRSPVRKVFEERKIPFPPCWFSVSL